MDRTLVHPESQEQDLSSSLVWKSNVPFGMIPIGLVEQAGIFHDDWLVWCRWYDSMPNYWNLAAFDKNDDLVAFVYGSWDPLDKEVRVIRITIHPSLFTLQGDLIVQALDKVRALASSVQAKMTYWETTKWRSFMRKLGDDVKLCKARVMEVV